MTLLPFGSIRFADSAIAAATAGLETQIKISFSYQFFDKFNAWKFFHCLADIIVRRMNIGFRASRWRMTENALYDQDIDIFIIQMRSQWMPQGVACIGNFVKLGLILGHITTSSEIVISQYTCNSMIFDFLTKYFAIPSLTISFLNLWSCSH